jgi:group I intron endonuclease
MISGIYCIENLLNNKKYIGKAKDINSRREYHFSRLKNNKHDNEYLQKSWNKYGKDNFNFNILEECCIEDLNEKEIYWILKLNTTNDKFGYNLTDGGDGASFGMKNPMFGKGLPEHLIGKCYQAGENHPKFGKKPINSRSKYFGLAYVFQSNKVYWKVRIKINKKHKEIGCFKTEVEGALAYNKYVIENNLPNPLNIIEI